MCFMNGRVIWLIGFAGLLGIWGLVWTVKQTAANRKATATAIIRHLNEEPLSQVAPADRAAYLSDLAETVNRMGYEERRQFALRRGLDATLEQMTEEERRVYLDRTVPEGFNQILQVFNKMTPQERRVAVDRAISDLKRAEETASEEDWARARARIEDGTLQKVADQGFQTYFKTASAETMRDLVPVIEQIQHNIRKLQKP